MSFLITLTLLFFLEWSLSLSFQPDTSAYSFLTPLSDLQNGLTSMGSDLRLRAAMQRFQEGGNLTLGFLGASVTEGAYMMDHNSDSKPWPNWASEIVSKHFPGEETQRRIRLVNGAMSATQSSWFAMCHHRRLTQDVDVVFIEFAINDLPHGPAKSIERLVRKLLMYPKRPAIVLMNWWLWHMPFFCDKLNTTLFGNYDLDANGKEFSKVAAFYGVQALSNRACCYNLMKKGLQGFKVDRPVLINSCWPQYNTSDDTRSEDFRLWKSHFYADFRHPNGYTGARVLGELASFLLLDAAASLKSRPLQPEEGASLLNTSLPAPLYEGNYGYSAQSCFLWDDVKKMTKTSMGWNWTTEQGRQKYGWSTETPGSILTLMVPASLPHPELGVRNVSLKINYIRSFRHMGRARVECESGCQCSPIEINALDQHLSTQTDAKPIEVTPSPECLLKITSLQETSDKNGGHRFKVNGVIVAEAEDNSPAYGADADQVEHQN